ncbi:cellulose synthase regulator protein [Hartmannibacter diazotrophicus]|uniref:Cyclic di-GMP-binding protein n=1 Tax=Hartmannibacter diazotrophicus TaxID=1482074 RepID=A0A2C9DE94_9HYPH|nr:cellulose biosynthesis cyclic di-GMP-binding regulatory protein BcsB [Hartmannibacter diazotrophicus]SON58085.1 cellulose synthase regulator protein [Hartmannibacter diazotrophicus]
MSIETFKTLLIGSPAMLALSMASGLAMAQTAASAEAFASIASIAAPLRPLPAMRDGLEFDGESAIVTYPVFLSDAEARSGGDLVLKLESSVAVMPEASRLGITLNGRSVETLPLGGPEAAAQKVALPAAMLHAGWNTLTLETSQRHRVDCSVEGTYELWTRIDPAASGLRFGAPMPSGLPALPYVGRNADGTMAIRLHTLARDAVSLSNAFRIAALTAKAAGATSAAVTLATDTADASRGLDLYYGSSEDLARLGISGEIVEAAANSVQLSASDAAPSASLVIAAGDFRQQARTEAELEAAARALGPRPGKVPEVEDAEVTFARLGVSSSRFSGRLFQRGVDIALPDDTMIADYASVRLSLVAAYAPGLGSDSGLGIRVNGKRVATLPFGRDGGELFEGRPIELPLSAFRPGLNHIDLEASLPQVSDQACSPDTQISGNPRLLFVDATSIRVPKLAHLERLPDLSGTIAEGRTGPGEAVHLAVTSADANTLSAAATFFTAMALAAPEVPKLVLSGYDPNDRRGGILIGDAGRLDARAADLVGLGHRSLAMLGQESNTLSRRFDDAFTQAPVSAGVQPDIGQPSPAADISDGTQMLKDWRGSVGAGAGNRLDSFVDASKSYLTQLAEWSGLGRTDEPLSVDARTRLVLAQAAPAGLQAPLTVVTAPTPSDLANGVRDLVKPANWQQIGGRAVLLGEDGVKIIESRHARLQALADTTPGNMRLVAAAWFSLNPVIYALMVVACVLAFGGLTAAVLRKGREETR